MEHPAAAGQLAQVHLAVPAEAVAEAGELQHLAVGDVVHHHVGQGVPALVAAGGAVFTRGGAVLAGRRAVLGRRHRPVFGGRSGLLGVDGGLGRVLRQRQREGERGEDARHAGDPGPRPRLATYQASTAAKKKYGTKKATTKATTLSPARTTATVPSATTTMRTRKATTITASADWTGFFPDGEAAHGEERAEGGEAGRGGADERGAPLAIAGGRGEQDGEQGRTGGDEQVARHASFFPSTVLKKLTNPTVIPTPAPTSRSHGVVWPSFWSPHHPRAVSIPTDATSCVEAPMYGAALR